MIPLQRIEEFAAAWYRTLDLHAPIEQCVSMLAETGLHMHFPDGDIQDFATFKCWYSRVTKVFFDERHTVRHLEVINRTDEEATIKVVVDWRATWWNTKSTSKGEWFIGQICGFLGVRRDRPEGVSPSAARNGVYLESTQTWTVRRCSAAKNVFGLEIVQYSASAEDFNFAPGSSDLPPLTSSGYRS